MIIETSLIYPWFRKSQRAEDKDDGAKTGSSEAKFRDVEYPAAPTYVTRLSSYFYIFFANSTTRGRRGSPTILARSSFSIETMDRTHSTPPSSASHTTKVNPDGQGGQFAFLVHSQDSVSQNTPPDVDDQRLTRQRRRRTRYTPPNIRHENCCLLIAVAAPKIMPFSKRNTKRTQNLTRRQDLRL